MRKDLKLKNFFPPGIAGRVEPGYMYAKVLFLLISFTIFSAFFTSTAQVSLEKIEGLPSKEIYDLHVDKKGYLWIAHSLGISRYDGLNFVQFTNPGLTALGMICVIEDAHGRIWCHNLSGQIFYIEQGKLKLLESYKYKTEDETPRMALCGDELLVTSRSGLFICSTTTLQARYIALDKVDSSTTSLAITGNTAVIFNHINWYEYQKETGIKKLDADPSIQVAKDNMVILQPSSYHDTIFLITNPAGTLQKLLIENSSIKRVGKIEYHDYINSVTTDAKIWVNTRNQSITTDSTDVIKGYNLSDIVTGKEGNNWYGSMKGGLLVNFQPSKWKKIKFPIDHADFVRSLNVSDGYFFAGTQKGYLVMMKNDTSAAVWKHNLFNGYGSIDFIRFVNNHKFIVGTPTNTYIADPLKKKIAYSLPLKAISDVDFDDNSLYLATANGFYVLPYLNSSLTLPQWKIARQKQFPFYRWNQNVDAPYLISQQRSQAIRFNKRQQSLFVSAKNGLQQVTSTGIHPFLINGKEVHASSLWYKDAQLYIATINDGLWIKSTDSLQHFTNANYLFSNTIVGIKVTQNHLWLLENNGIQVFDIGSNKILHIDLPKITGADVFDVAEKDGYVYFTTGDGVFKVPILVVSEKAPAGYMDYVVVNNKDTLTQDNIQLPHDKNDLQFFFSSPAFYNPEAVSFKYRLTGDDDHWQTVEPNERMLRFSSLPAGSYTFEAMATNKDGMQQQQPIRFSFVILKSWWNHWWVIVLMNLIIVAIAYLVIRGRINQRLKVELIRRGIAGDLHDDIGATLSSINIYTEMAQEEMGKNEYLDHIKENVDDTISRLDDLVWNINPRNDTMEQLINRIQYTSAFLFEAAGIQCHFNYNKKILDTKLSLADKRNVYLLFKEIVNNVVKHSRCRNCYINIEYSYSLLTLSVKDDGVGFDTASVKKGRNGLENMRNRVRRMHGNIQINSSDKNGCYIIAQVKA